MDDATLDSLKAALEESPRNGRLLEMVLEGHLELGREPQAWELVRRLDTGAVTTSKLRLLIARVCLGARRPEEAVEWADGDEPEALVVRATALAELGRMDEGRQSYERAVAANPTLEDPGLKALLQSRVRKFPDRAGDGSGLRIISPTEDGDDDIKTLLAPGQDEVGFDDVGGLDAIKKQIHKRIILPFLKPSLYQRFRKRTGGGILLYGPPGCGKTLLARATAGECRASFFNVAISDVLDMYIGESERKLHAIFEKARAATPAVLFFDELEALGGRRQHTRDATTAKLVSLFLSEMDGFTKTNQGVLILGATNVPWSVDTAFRRPGRFDRFLFVPPPDRAARERILEIHLEGRPVEEHLGLGTLAKATSGFSGADLLNIIETAADFAIEESLEAGDERPLSARHLKDSLKEVKATTLEWLTTARNHARYANEAGQYDDVLEFLRKHGGA